MATRAFDSGLVVRLASALHLKTLVESAPEGRSEALEHAATLFSDVVPLSQPDQAPGGNELWWLSGPAGRVLEDLERLGEMDPSDAVIVEDARPFLEGGDAGPDLMDLVAALRQAGPTHRLLFRGRALFCFPEVAEALVKAHTGQRSIGWTDTRFRSEEFAAVEARLEAREHVIEKLSRELERANRERADKDEFIRRLSGKLPLMQTLVFVDARVRRYAGAALWPARLAVRLLLKAPLRTDLAIRLNHEKQYRPRPLPPPADYEPAVAPADPPLISIVTPSYNQASFLRETMGSVLDQGYPRLEYVVQDGGSTDGTVELLQEQEGALTAWESKRDEGQADAVNQGMRRVNGDILAWLNSDDLLLPGALAYVASYFDAHPEVDVVYGHRILIDAEGREIGRWVLPPHDDETLRWADYVPQETLFWRRRIWEAAGGFVDDEFHFALDWDLLLRFAGAGARMARLPRFLGAFRIHDLQKNTTIGHVHKQEVRKLITRTHGRDMSAREIHRHMKPFFRRHVACDRLHRLGLYRCGMRSRFRRRPRARTS